LWRAPQLFLASLADNNVLRVCIRNECKAAIHGKLAGSERLEFKIAELPDKKSPT
jgi:hypothetical protein